MFVCTTYDSQTSEASVPYIIFGARNREKVEVVITSVYYCILFCLNREACSKILILKKIKLEVFYLVCSLTWYLVIKL